MVGFRLLSATLCFLLLIHLAESDLFGKRDTKSLLCELQTKRGSACLLQAMKFGRKVINLLKGGKECDAKVLYAVMDVEFNNQCARPISESQECCSKGTKCGSFTEEYQQFGIDAKNLETELVAITGKKFHEYFSKPDFS